jgi:hypothetical protein
MNTTGIDERSPEQIEGSITARREALKGKLNELGYKLSPAERVRDVRDRIDPAAVAPWAAVGAVATGAWLAMRGLRRRHAANGHGSDMSDVGDMSDLVDETICVDVAVPPNVVP